MLVVSKFSERIRIIALRLGLEIRFSKRGGWVPGTNSTALWIYEIYSSMMGRVSSISENHRHPLYSSALSERRWLSGFADLVGKARGVTVINVYRRKERFGQSILLSSSF